jgi:hypothetical protein
MARVRLPPLGKLEYHSNISLRSRGQRFRSFDGRAEPEA